MQYENAEKLNIQYENVEKLNRQAMWFVIIHTIIVFNLVLDVSFFT